MRRLFVLFAVATVLAGIAWATLALMPRETQAQAEPTKYDVLFRSISIAEKNSPTFIERVVVHGENDESVLWEKYDKLEGPFAEDNDLSDRKLLDELAEARPDLSFGVEAKWQTQLEVGADPILVDWTAPGAQVELHGRPGLQRLTDGTLQLTFVEYPEFAADFGTEQHPGFVAEFSHPGGASGRVIWSPLPVVPAFATVNVLGAGGDKHAQPPTCFPYYGLWTVREAG